MDWTKITFNIGEVRRANGALSKSASAAEAAGSVSIAMGDYTPPAFAAYSSAMSAKSLASSKAGSFRRMSKRLKQRLDHMRDFGHDLPSRWATAEGAAKARARGKRLAKEFRRRGEIDATRIGAMKGDPDAVFGFLEGMSKGDLVNLLGSERLDYHRDDLTLIYDTINEVGVRGFNDGKIRAKLVQAVAELDPKRTLRSLGILNGHVGGKKSGDRFHPSLVGIFAASTFSKMHLYDGGVDIGGFSYRKLALDIFKKAIGREDVAGSMMSHRDTLEQVLTADAITTNVNRRLTNEDLSRNDFIKAVEDLLRRGFTPPSEAKYQAILAATNGWKKDNGKISNGINRIVDGDDEERSMPNRVADLVAGTLSPYLIDPDFIAARLLDGRTPPGGKRNVREDTMKNLGNALVTLGRGGGEETQDHIAAFLALGQAMNWNQYEKSAEGTKHWIALAALDNQLDAQFKAHGAGLRVYESAEDLATHLDLIDRGIGVSEYLPLPYLVTMYGNYASHTINTERVRLESDARYVQRYEEYEAELKARFNESEIEAIAESLAQRTEKPSRGFEGELTLLLTRLMAIELKDQDP